MGVREVDCISAALILRDRRRLVAIAFSALLAESFLLVQNLRLDFFPFFLVFGFLFVIGSKDVVVDLFQGYVFLSIQILYGTVRVEGCERSRPDTHDFPKQNDILTPDEEQTVPALRKGTPVVYSLNSIFEYKVGCMAD
jgi:hypothetical protein